MTLTQLEIFNAVASTGSISAGAKRVHRVPSNLTTRIQQLEKELGVSLFIRESQRLRLSPAGHSFLHYSQRILALVEEARTAMMPDNPCGLLSLGALESTAAVRIPALLAEFNQRFARIQLDLSTGPSGEMVMGVLDGTLGAAFVDGPLDNPALEGIPAFDEEMVVIAPRQHATITEGKDVDGESIYAFRPNCAYRRHFERWFHESSAAPGKIHEIESYHSMLACVIAGAGLALMPRSMLESMPGSRQVSVWSLADKWKTVCTWLIWRRDAKTPQLEALISLLPTYSRIKYVTSSPATR